MAYCLEPIMLRKPFEAFEYRIRMLVVVLALSATADICSGQQAMDASGLYEKLVSSVWTVVVNTNTSRQIGSAVVMGDGRLVTNCHVLSGGHSIAIVHQNVSYGARLLAPDAERDLCLITAENFHAPAVNIASPKTIKIGERVFAIGSPVGRENTLSDGLVSEIDHGLDGAVNRIQFTAPISHGSSGGGLFDSEGRLVGITSSMISSSEAQNINFAIPAEWIVEIPARAQVQLARWREQQAARIATTASVPPSQPTTSGPEQGDFVGSTTSGTPILLSSHGEWLKKTCQARSIPTITTIQSPEHGRLDIKEGDFKIGSQTGGRCVGQTITGIQVFYISNPDFKGREVIRYISSGAPTVTKTAIVDVR
ncbi:S1C family serine protease [Paraburkholderia youngii]|uniref:Trypsin-like peptidase domain-containing protein n=2 Tax=Paraburkholderia youngii TaxID=2782701 RepID=A0ABX2NGT2_9BURK|nr:trypsin-like peptidase domain-containing protein [Paraburkholderia youngii]